MEQDNIFDAVERGDLAAVRDSVSADPRCIALQGEVGSTPLLWAIGGGNLAIVSFLLESGSDPNVEVDDGYTCLLLAVESESSESVELVNTLISAGADIHQTGTNGWTPLHMAAARGHLAKARRLLDSGAEIDRRTEIDGCKTPLMEAAFGGHPDVVRLLLDRGADPSLRDAIHDKTPRQIARDAAAGPDPDVVQSLREEETVIDVAESFADSEFSPEQLKWLKQELGEIDMAEMYIEHSRSLAESGNHAEVIEILSACEDGSGEA